MREIPRENTRSSRIGRSTEWIAAAVAVLCYANVLPNDFCHDDDPIVRFNDQVSAPGHWLTIWTTDYWSRARDESPNRDLLYRPIAVTSYRLIRVLLGPHPFPQHLLNVLLHALAAVLVVRLCRRMELADPVSLAAGVLFAVLPIHSEVVASVVGRADILATLGVLLAILSHRRSLLAASGATSAAWRVAAALAAFGAMGAKESGVAAALLIVLYDAFWARLRQVRHAASKWWSWRTARRLAYLLFPCMIYLVLRSYALGGHLHERAALTKTINVLVDSPPWQHALGVLQLWGMYWAKTLWPAVLCVNYSINAVRLATGPLDQHVVLGVLIAVGLIIFAAVRWRRNDRLVALSVAALAVSYAPTANALVLMRVFFAERIWYLPSVWVAIMIALVVAPLLRVRVVRAVGVVVILAMIARGWIRSTEWRDNGTLYAAAYRDHPQAVGCLQLYGQWLVNNGAYSAGVDLLERAIEIDMGYTDAQRTLGQAQLRAGHWREAVRHLQIADMQAPGHSPTVDGLGRAGRELFKQEGEQLSRLEQTANNRPDDVEAEIAVIRKMRDLGRVRDALDRLRAGEPRFSSSVVWQTEYAVTLVYLNDRDGAIERYRRAVELGASDPQLMVELAMLLLERRQNDDLEHAWDLAKRASRLAPGAPSVLVCRAELLAQRGDVHGAIAAYQEAIRSLPPDSDQRRVLEQRARALGR
ncbi:MAG: tetratricopeptide repeat protein [Planctomycetota bacterium]